MKKFISMLASTFLILSVFAQSPEKLSYQAVIRNATNTLVVNSPVGMRFSILLGSATGTPVYVETQTPTSNVNGLITTEIGSGNIVSGVFSTIDWSKGVYFIKTETDPLGGIAYTITLTNQLLSVPYALYAKNSGSSLPGPKGDKGDTGPQGPQGPAGNGSAVHTIGENYGGGIVFYVYDNGQHGLIAATTDYKDKVRWYGGSHIVTGATANGVGGGMKNTSISIANQASVDGATFAARVCNEYKVKVNGVTYGDWYLPSKDELILMNEQKAVTGFAGQYWSSTEYDSKKAFSEGGFVPGPSQGEIEKETLLLVRPIRAF